MDNRMSNKTGKCVIFVAMFDYPQDPQNYQKRENPSIDCLMYSWTNWNLEGNPYVQARRQGGFGGIPPYGE